MNQTERKERIKELADKTIASLNKQQKKITDQFFKVSETVISGKADGKPQSLQGVMEPIVNVVKLYSAIEDYIVSLNEMKAGLESFPPIKIVAELLGLDPKDVITVFANQATADLYHDVLKRIDDYLFHDKEQVSEKEENSGEEIEKDKEEEREEEDEEFDVLISFGKNKEGKNFLDQLIEDETEDKAFVLKRNAETGYIDAFVGLKCVDEKGTVGYKCTRWKPAKYGDLCITGSVVEEEDDEEDDQE